MNLFRKRPADSRAFTRVYFTTDIHGSEPAFIKFLNAAEHYQADALVLGGDITGKMLISILRTDEGWESHLFGQRRVAQTEAELTELEKAIRTNGYYPYRTTREEVSELEADPDKLDELFTQLMKQSVARWVDMAEERLAGERAKVYISLGNDDRDDVIPILEGSSVVTYADGKVLPLDDTHVMASVGYANMTPWRCPRDVTEEELATIIEQVVEGVEDLGSSVFNFHVPPYDSGLDLAPELNEDLSPVLVGGQPNIIPVGSTAVREAIERWQPLAGLHGHIHESRGTTRIGRTLCINPGSEYSEGVLRGVLLNLQDGEVLSHQLVSG